MNWDEFWKDFKPFIVNNVFFESLIDKFPKGSKNFVELGGFPGTYSIFFKKRLSYNCTIIDTYCPKDVINSMLKLNGLKQDDLKIINKDLNRLERNMKFDVVMSAGLVEHFKDYDSVLLKHIKLLDANGTLFISIPNLYSITGFFLACMNRSEFKNHNKSLMNIRRFKNVLQKYDLKELDVFYHGNPVIWQKKSSAKFSSRVISKISRILQKIPFRGKFFSPHIIVIAKKNG